MMGRKPKSKEKGKLWIDVEGWVRLWLCVIGGRAIVVRKEVRKGRRRRRKGKERRGKGREGHD
jgi:hypothetical protein